jgi:hypothetical protein
MNNRRNRCRRFARSLSGGCVETFVVAESRPPSGGAPRKNGVAQMALYAYKIQKMGLTLGTMVGISCHYIWGKDDGGHQTFSLYKEIGKV